MVETPAPVPGVRDHQGTWCSGVETTCAFTWQSTAFKIFLNIPSAPFIPKSTKQPIPLPYMGLKLSLHTLHFKAQIIHYKLEATLRNLSKDGFYGWKYVCEFISGLQSNQKERGCQVSSQRNNFSCHSNFQNSCVCSSEPVK